MGYFKKEKKKINYTEARKRALRHNEKKILLSDEELQIVKERAAALNMKVGTYIRTIAVKGEIKRYDMKAVNDVRIELLRIGTNINQVAHMVNATQSVNQADIDRIQKEMKRLKATVESWLKPFD